MTHRPRTIPSATRRSASSSRPRTPAARRAGARRSRSTRSSGRRTTSCAPKSGRSSNRATRAGSRAGSRPWTWRRRSNAAFPSRRGSLPPMPALRRFDVDELLTRPGTYFNPETEIVIVVDDSAHVDLELLGDEEDEDAAEWILLSDEPAVDEHKRDELVEAFETRR